MAPAGQLIILKNDTFILTDLTGSSRDLGMHTDMWIMYYYIR
jgi:hypothetical protein